MRAVAPLSLARLDSVRPSYINRLQLGHRLGTVGAAGRLAIDNENIGTYADKCEDRLEPAEMLSIAMSSTMCVSSAMNNDL
jgi:hypothetical protein